MHSCLGVCLYSGEHFHAGQLFAVLSRHSVCVRERGGDTHTESECGCVNCNFRVAVISQAHYASRCGEKPDATIKRCSMWEGAGKLRHLVSSWPPSVPVSLCTATPSLLPLASQASSGWQSGGKRAGRGGGW